MQRRERLVMTSVRLDPELHDMLRRIAFERHRSMHSLLLEGARLACGRYVDAPAYAAPAPVPAAPSRESAAT